MTKYDKDTQSVGMMLAAHFQLNGIAPEDQAEAMSSILEDLVEIHWLGDAFIAVLDMRDHYAEEDRKDSQKASRADFEDILGVERVGYIQATHADLVKVFGVPNGLDDRLEWYIRFHDDTVVCLWIEDALAGPGGQGELVEWCVNSKNRLAVQTVLEYMAANK